MTMSSNFSFSIFHFTFNNHFSFFSGLSMINDKLLRINNCKLLITSAGGRV
jgi:hypothetical protein